MTLYCFSFLFSQQSTPICLFCSARACRLFHQPCADHPWPVAKQQLAADGDSFRNYCVDLSCFCAGVTYFPRRRGGQNLSLLNVGSLVSLMICTVMTIVASRNRGWLLLPIVYAFALINLAFATFVPNEYITHLETTRECWCTSACRSSLTQR